MPKRAEAYTFAVSLVSQGNPFIMQANPTLAAGDVKVSIDGGTLTNLTSLPTVSPASGKQVLVSLSAAEMTGDVITVIFSDASGAEWQDMTITMNTSIRDIDDILPISSYTAPDNATIAEIDGKADQIISDIYDLTHAGGEPIVRIIPPPETPQTCRVYEYAYTQNGAEPLDPVHATAKINNLPFDYNGVLHDGSVIEASETTPDESGNYAIYWDLPYTAEAVIILTEHGVRHQITVPAETTARVAVLIEEEEE